MAENWLAKLDEIRAVEKIIGIDEDVLGAYFFRVPEIRLYWVVIGITARALGVPPDALTIVVLAHELAHAYTHLGRDIDNERWDTERFAKSDLDIVEGLAQYACGSSNACRQHLRRMRRSCRSKAAPIRHTRNGLKTLSVAAKSFVSVSSSAAQEESRPRRHSPKLLSDTVSVSAGGTNR
jgi:hypothetical protein